MKTCSDSCAIGYYESNYKCLPCDQSCLNCFNESVNSCNSCSNTSNYPYFNSELKTCSKNCSIGYYDYYYNCLPCDITC